MELWRQKLQNVQRALQRQRVNAFKVASDLVAIHGDPKFLASEEIGGDDAKAIVYLDIFAAKLFVIVPNKTRHPYCDLASMLEIFPKETAWKTGDLSEMFRAVLDREPEKEDPSPAKPRRTVTRAQHETLEKEVEKLRRENTQLHQRVAELQNELLNLREKLAEPIAA